YEVSNRDYREYIKTTGKSVPRHWISNGYALSLKKKKVDTLNRKKLREIFSDHIASLQNNKALSKIDILKTINSYWKNLDFLPIENISWHQANAYCESVGKRLPGEAEWEHAAGGNQHLEFPWGNEWHAGWSNTLEEDWPYNSAPVGSYQTDKSPYGIYDLAGNVQEWINDWYQAYPGSKDNDPDYGHTHRIVRGGGYGSIGHYALPIFSRSSFRSHLRPDTTQAGIGFRCAKDK
ncbi:MAG: formylglycine-generating enzyme family protein, partial [Gammaproteobacteria bacterium]|nr:formylglycine-generating enzyme family protein [Gammaproteobacteria bacterium]